MKRSKQSPEILPGLYWHFPFCRNLCGYCHFYRMPYRQELVSEYLRLSALELGLYCDAISAGVATIYFGGGSPSLLEAEQIELFGRLLEGIIDRGTVLEWTVELNPGEISAAKLKALRALGVNRISLGAQSFVDKDLEILGRRYKKRETFRAIELIRGEGFDNLSLDLMLGFSGQSDDSVKDNLRILAETRPEHLSLYIFSLKNDRHPARREDFILRNYLHCRERLGALGYHHYEVSNFALPGGEGRHNLLYWKNMPYLGLGRGASGFWEGCDYRNFKNPRAYERRLILGMKPVALRRFSSPLKRALVCGLRLLEGLDGKTVASSSRPEALEEMLAGGFLIEKGGNIAVNPVHLLLLNEILVRILPD